MDAWKGKRKYLATGIVTIDDLAKNMYWKNEAPLYEAKKMEVICSQFSIDTVITHTAPSFCELFTKGGLHYWIQNDDTLLDDVEAERTTMDKLRERLVRDHHPVSHWFYGHFHQSWHSSIDGILFRMLDIMEFCSVY